MKCCDLIGFIDVANLDLEPASMAFRHGMEPGAGAAANGRDHVPAAVEILFGQGQAKSTGCANDEGGFGR